MRQADRLKHCIHIVLECNVKYKKLSIVPWRRGETLENLEKRVEEKQVMSFKFPLWKEIYKWINIVEKYALRGMGTHSGEVTPVFSFLPPLSMEIHPYLKEYAPSGANGFLSWNLFDHLKNRYFVR